MHRKKMGKLYSRHRGNWKQETAYRFWSKFRVTVWVWKRGYEPNAEKYVGY